MAEAATHNYETRAKTRLSAQATEMETEYDTDDTIVNKGELVPQPVINPYQLPYDSQQRTVAVVQGGISRPAEKEYKASTPAGETPEYPNFNVSLDTNLADDEGPDGSESATSTEQPITAETVVKRRGYYVDPPERGNTIPSHQGNVENDEIPHYTGFTEGSLYQHVYDISIQMNKLNTENNNLRSEVETLRIQQKDIILETNTKFHAEIRELRKDITKSDTKVGVLTTALERKEMEIEDLRFKYRDRGEHMNTMIKDIAQQCSETGHLKRRNTELLEKHSELTNRVTELQKELSTVRERGVVNYAYNTEPQQQNTYTETIKGPEIFKGKSSKTSAKTWLQSYLRHANRMAWNNKFRALNFASYLEGPALHWYTSLPNEVIEDLDNVSAQFLEKFKPTAGNQGNIILFFNIKQKPNQNVEEFATHLKQEAEKSSIPDDYVLQAFMNGLKPSLSDKVTTIGPKSMEEAELIAARLEVNENTRKLTSGHQQDSRQQMIPNAQNGRNGRHNGERKQTFFKNTATQNPEFSARPRTFNFRNYSSRNDERRNVRNGERQQTTGKSNSSGSTQAEGHRQETIGKNGGQQTGRNCSICGLSNHPTEKCFKNKNPAFQHSNPKNSKQEGQDMKM